MKQMTPFEAMQAGYYLSSALGETALVLRNHKISRVRVGERDYFSKTETDAFRATFRAIEHGEIKVRPWADAHGTTVARIAAAGVPMVKRFAGTVAAYFAQEAKLDAWWDTAGKSNKLPVAPRSKLDDITRIVDEIIRDGHPSECFRAIQILEDVVARLGTDSRATANADAIGRIESKLNRVLKELGIS